MAASPDIISGLLSDPNTAPYLGAAMGLLGSSGASRLPVTMGAAMGNALGGSQQYAQQAIQNSLARENFAYQAMWMRAMGIDPLTGKPLQTPTQQLTDLSQGSPGPASKNQQQLTDLSQANPVQTALAASGGASNPVQGSLNSDNAEQNNLLNAITPQQGAPSSGNQHPQSTQPASQFAPGYEKLSTMVPQGMNPYVFMGAMMKDPGRLASTMYANNPTVKANESSLAIDQQMMQRAAQNNDANSFALWQQKAFEDSGSIQHTFGGIANVLGMGPGGSWIAGKPPEATTMINGRVQLAPGALNAITATELAHKVVPYVNPVTGATTGYTSALNTGLFPNQSQPTTQLPASTNQRPAMTQAGAGPQPVLSIGAAQTAGQEVIGKQATEQLTEAINQQQNAQQQIPQLADLEASLNSLSTGPGKENQLAVKRGLSAFAHGLGLNVTFNGDLSNQVVANKSIVNFTAQLVRGLGAREPAQVVKFIESGMQSIKNPSDANAVLTGLMRGTAEYKIQMGNYAQNWQKNYGSGYVPGQGTFQGTWQQHADPLAYIWESLPPFEQQEITQAAAKNKTLLYELQRANASQTWLKNNGYWEQANATQ